jgi:phage repressor protein C with HTH and peptisase S24 domain
MMNMLRKNIIHLMGDMNPSELARASGAKQPNIFRIIEGGIEEPRDKTLEPLAQYWGITVFDLKYKDLTGQSTKQEVEQRIIQRETTYEIPLYDVRASMGTGAVAPAYENVVEKMTVSAPWLNANLRFSNKSYLALITAYGDSMGPTFNDGDLLLIDRSVEEIKIDAVYVLLLHDELYIKRLQRRPDGSILMISDNKNYEPYTIKNGDMDNFKVLGRVLLAWNAKKL